VGLLDGIGRTVRPESSPTSTDRASLGARTGSWWLNDGLLTRPATAGAAASPIAVNAAAVRRNTRFMSVSKRLVELSPTVVLPRLVQPPSDNGTSTSPPDPAWQTIPAGPVKRNPTSLNRNVYSPKFEIYEVPLKLSANLANVRCGH
jgi:hypothetical protein